MLGMGGTAAYFTGTTDPTTMLGHLMRPSWGSSGSPYQGGNNSEMDNLYKLVSLSQPFLTISAGSTAKQRSMHNTFHVLGGQSSAEEIETNVVDMTQ